MRSNLKKIEKSLDTPGLGIWSIIIIIALFHDHFGVLGHIFWVPDQIFFPNSCLKCFSVSFPYFISYSWSTQWRFFNRTMLWNVSAVSFSGCFVGPLNHKNHFVVNGEDEQRLKRMPWLWKGLWRLVTNKVCLVSDSFYHRFLTSNCWIQLAPHRQLNS